MLLSRVGGGGAPAWARTARPRTRRVRRQPVQALKAATPIEGPTLSSEQDEARKWRTQLEMAREEHRREKSKLVKENKGLEKERARLQGKDTQWAAKLRKAESESSRLKDTLQKMHAGVGLTLLYR